MSNVTNTATAAPLLNTGPGYW